MDTKLPLLIVKGTLLAIVAVLAVTVLTSVLALLSFVLTIVVIGALIFLPLNILFGRGGAWHGYWQKGVRFAKQSLGFSRQVWHVMLHHSRGAMGSIGAMSKACGVILVELSCGAAVGVLLTVAAFPDDSNPAIYIGAGLLGGLFGFLIGWSQLRWETAPTDSSAASGNYQHIP